jgi:hypothetical protein
VSEQAMSAPLYYHGILARFDEPEHLVWATEQAHAAGYRRMDGYSPFPIEGLADALGMHFSWVPRIVLTFGIIGGLFGVFLELLSMGVWYPINVGGRPYASWPSFVPPAYELTILFASLSAMVCVVVLNKLPQPYHPVFNVEKFARATTDGFFLCIEASDPKFDPTATAEFLRSVGAREVFDVPE